MGGKMHKTVTEAYEYLVPADQLIVDAMIVTLAHKDKEISNLAREIMKSLDKEE